MDKKKKIIIIAVIAVIVIALIVGLVLFLKKPKNNKKTEEANNQSTNLLDDPKPIEEKTYTYKKKSLTKTKEKQYLLVFNSNGGQEIHDRLVDAEIEFIELPVPVREGYVFNGWNNSWGKRVSGQYSVYLDETFTAEWVPARSVKTMTVTYETNTSLTLNKETFICDKPLYDLPYYIEKEGYSFKGWFNDEGTRVKDGSIIECKDTTLHAEFVRSKIYECPSDYLNYGDGYCYKQIDPTTACPSDTIAYRGYCVRAKDYKEPTSICNDLEITVSGEKVVEHGEYYDGYCIYHEYDVSSQEECEAIEDKPRWTNGKCFNTANPSANTIACPSETVLYDPAKDKSLLGDGAPDKPVCLIPIKEEFKCPEGYEYKEKGLYFNDQNKCIQKIEAIVK